MNSIEEKLAALENEGMIDLMHHQWVRFQAVQIHINLNALWQKWIRR